MFKRSVTQWRRLLRSQRGGFDLASVVIAILVTAAVTIAGSFMTVGIMGAVNDGSARDALGPAVAAQSVAKATDRKYLDGDDLVDKKYLNENPSVAIKAGASGGCFVGVSTSKTGRTFFVTDQSKSPKDLYSTTALSCVPSVEISALAAGLGATLEASAETKITLAYPDPSFELSNPGKVISPNVSGGKGSLGFSLSGNLPPGISFNPSTGGLSKTPGPWDSSVDSVAQGFGTHQCLISEATVSCWGSNTYGQLGDGAASTTAQSAPNYKITRAAFNEKKPEKVVVGAKHTCTIASGEAFCWGANDYGQLGNGTSNNSATPTPVATEGTAMAGKKVTDISAGIDTTCAVAEGELYCWGSGAHGIRGDGVTGVPGSTSSARATSTPTAAIASGTLSGKEVTSVSVGPQQVCAIASSKPYCWGKNTNGVLGAASPTLTQTAVALPVDTSGALSGRTVTAVSLGGTTAHPFACAIAGEQVGCWGSGATGALGIAGFANSRTPVLAAGALLGKSITGLAASTAGVCATTENSVMCWGNGVGTPTQVSIPEGSLVGGVSVGTPGSCMILSGGLYCSSATLGTGVTPVPGFGGNAGFPSSPITITVTDGNTTTVAGPLSIGLR